MRNGEKQGGYSLVETSFGLLIIGFLLVAGIYLYHLHATYKRINVTEHNTKTIQTALQDFIHRNGRLPCPASNTAPLDSPEFGMEIASVCTGNHAGTARDSAARVMIGSVPVRALNISDAMIMDGWRQRFIYAVTEDFALDGADMGGTEGTITVTDVNDNSLSSAAGKAIFALLSPGQDSRGAYDLHGNLMAPCEPGTVSGENCNGDAKFVDSVYKSFNDTSLLTSNMSFGANLTRYEWITEAYGPCTGVCGSGTQTRVVKCVNHKGDKVDDALCKEPKPSTTQSCDSVECKWQTGNFGDCACNSVSVSRPVFCVGAVGEKVDDSYCKGARPESSMACIDSVARCRYIWRVKPWGACSAQCNGTQTRVVYCTREDNDIPVADSKCTDPKPGTSQACGSPASVCDPVIPCTNGTYCGATPPTNSCFFYVTGASVEDQTSGVSSGIGILDNCGTLAAQFGFSGSCASLVGKGDYPYSSPPHWQRIMHDFSHVSEYIDPVQYPLGRASASTFDGLAIGNKTRIIIYEQPNFQGAVVVDLHGPLVMNNWIWRDMYPSIQQSYQKDWSYSSLLAQFTPGTRKWSDQGYEGVLPMQYWGRQTSIKVLCD